MSEGRSPSSLGATPAIALAPFLYFGVRWWDSCLGEQPTPTGLFFFYLTGADCLGKSPLGRTPLHVVAAMGRTDCIRPLLEHGASIHDRDAKGDSPVTIARRLNRMHFERKMFLLYWMIKSGTKDPDDLTVKEAPKKPSPESVSKKILALSP